jgi:hypothetical protein
VLGVAEDDVPREKEKKRAHVTLDHWGNSTKKKNTEKNMY